MVSSSEDHLLLDSTEVAFYIRLLDVFPLGLLFAFSVEAKGFCMLINGKVLCLPRHLLCSPPRAKRGTTVLCPPSNASDPPNHAPRNHKDLDLAYTF